MTRSECGMIAAGTSVCGWAYPLLPLQVLVVDLEAGGVLGKQEAVTC